MLLDLPQCPPFIIIIIIICFCFFFFFLEKVFVFVLYGGVFPLFNAIKWEILVQPIGKNKRDQEQEIFILKEHYRDHPLYLLVSLFTKKRKRKRNIGPMKVK